jgi:glucose-6-phosphate 1-dehydrogenase
MESHADLLVIFGITGDLARRMTWRPVVRRRYAGLAAPQRIAEGGAQMPGHHPLG